MILFYFPKMLKSKKGLENMWWLLIAAIAAVAVGGIVLFIVGGGFSRFSKSAGCGGVFSSYTGEEYFCHIGDVCPPGSKAASSSAWSVLSGGCGSGRVCCIGEKPETAEGGGEGALDIRLGKADGTSLKNGQTYKLPLSETFFFKGTGDIKKCSATMYCKEEGCVDKEDNVKDKETPCSGDYSSFSYTFDVEGDYEMHIVGYNANGNAVDSSRVYLKAEKGEEPAAEEPVIPPEQPAEQESKVIFNAYYYAEGSDQISYVELKEGEIASIDMPIENDMIYYDLECNCMLIINNFPEISQPGSYSAQAFLLEPQINKFELETFEGEPIDTYYIRYNPLNT